MSSRRKTRQSTKWLTYRSREHGCGLYTISIHSSNGIVHTTKDEDRRVRVHSTNSVEYKGPWLLFSVMCTKRFTRDIQLSLWTGMWLRSSQHWIKMSISWQDYPTSKNKSGSSSITSANWAVDQQLRRITTGSKHLYPLFLDHVFHLLDGSVGGVISKIVEDAHRRDLATSANGLSESRHSSAENDMYLRVLNFA